MLRCEQCRVRAGTFVLELDRLRVEPGEHCLVVGPSGSGKSLLLRAVAGLVHPEAGTVLLCGEDARDLPPEARRIGLVFQHYSLVPHLTVLDNVAFGLRMRGAGRRDARERAAGVLERLRVAHLAGRRSATLSGGEQQRVAIARAVATGADLLLLDEPFAALDPATRASCRLELAALRRELGLTVVEVTHALEEAGAHADRVLVLDAGRVVADGPHAELVARPPSLRAARALALPNLIPPGLVGNGWTCVPPAAVTIVPADAARGTGAPAGRVESVEDLGPVRRVRLLLDDPSGGLLLEGFAEAGTAPPVPGGRAAALLLPGAIRSLPE